MILKRVRYQNFRNIASADISFSPGINLFCGDNAQGKTNALEGIYLFAQGRSHRTAKEKDYITYEQDFAKVILDYENKQRENQLELRYLRSGRKFCRKNGLALRKMSEFIGNFNAVIFCPEYLSVVREGPSQRRAFMDGALAQTDRVYLSALQKYNAALLQRNRLIAEYPFHPEAFDQTEELWAEQLAEEGEILSFKRAEYMEKIEKEVRKIFEDMMEGKEEPRLLYRKPMKKEEYMELFRNNRQRELKAGTTLFGVHKDDIEILLNDRSARVFASQGQQRSIAVAMKLAEGEVCREKTGEFPVFLLDDVFSELDDRRKNYILSGMEGRQVLITCCDRKDAERIPDGRVIFVEKGQYTTVR